MSHEACVLTYGAVGDGIADDAPAISAALSSGAAIVRVPAGRYRLASSIEIGRDGQTLRGEGQSSQLVSEADGVAISFANRQRCSASGFLLRSATAAVGVYVGDVAHHFAVDGVMIDGSLGGFQTAGIQISRSFYGSVMRCDVIHCGVGIYGANECNGNTISANSIRQCDVGIMLTDDIANSDGCMVVGNCIESAQPTAQTGITIRGADSNCIVGNRIELTSGRAHIDVIRGAGPVNFTQIIGNVLEGTIAALHIGDALDGTGVSGTFISGGRGAGAVDIRASATNTTLEAAPGAYGGALTDAGIGSRVTIDPANGRFYAKTWSSNVPGYRLQVGGVATVIDVGGNYFDLRDSAGVMVRAEKSGRLRAVRGSLSAGGDSGGLDGHVTISNVASTEPRGTGAGRVLFADGTARDSVGMLKVYIGGQTRWVPLFDAP